MPTNEPFFRETENTPEWVLWGENWYGLVVRGDVRKFYGRTIGFGGKWIPCPPPWSGGQRRHLSPEYLNHRSPTALPSRAPSARTDRLAHFRTPMVEWFVTLAVGESRDDAVITFLASPVLIAGCIFVVRSIAKSLEYLVLTTKSSVQSLTSHVGPQPKSDEASVGEFRVVGRGKCTVWHSHFDVLSFEIPRMCTWAPVRRKHEGSGHLMSNQSSTGAGSAINSFRSSSLSSYFQGEQG